MSKRRAACVTFQISTLRSAGCSDVFWALNLFLKSPDTLNGLMSNLSLGFCCAAPSLPLLRRPNRRPLPVRFLPEGDLEPRVKPVSSIVGSIVDPRGDGSSRSTELAGKAWMLSSSACVSASPAAGTVCECLINCLARLSIGKVAANVLASGTSLVVCRGTDEGEIAGIGCIKEALRAGCAATSLLPLELRSSLPSLWSPSLEASDRSSSVSPVRLLDVLEDVSSRMTDGKASPNMKGSGLRLGSGLTSPSMPYSVPRPQVSASRVSSGTYCTQRS
mmetsp:Transcript_14136/g.35751  ORF Transcript_14136/g.35751 Transcript_14136/m.35751 type:complete len:276 (-) Transcript_14136:855-1682(-)